MADLSKIIKGLECCVNRGDCQNECDKWPDNGCERGLMCDALELLKTQEADIKALHEKYADLLDRTMEEPVKPKEHEIVVGTSGAEFMEFLCGKCGCGLINNPKWRTKFCPECGRAVKWE